MVKMQRLGKHWKILAAAIICIALITGSVLLWQRGNVAEAALIEPHPGLVGWWRFDEGTGSIAKDSSGNGNDATIYGATWVEDGKYGKALSFDGVDDYIEIDNDLSLQLTGDLTISLWIYAESLPRMINCLTEKYWNGEFALFVYQNGMVRFAHGAPNEELTVLPAGSVTTGQWIHLAVTRNMTSMQVTGYKNGEAGTPQTITTVPQASELPVYIGIESAADWAWHGYIDEVRIYNRALSATEIQEIFEKGPEFSSNFLVKVPANTTQVIVTVSWQGTGDINVTIKSPSNTYTEGNVTGVYQKNVYSTTDSTSGMLNIKRLSISVSALPSNENWYIKLAFDNIEAYRITVEIQK